MFRRVVGKFRPVLFCDDRIDFIGFSLSDHTAVLNQVAKHLFSPHLDHLRLNGIHLRQIPRSIGHVGIVILQILFNFLRNCGDVAFSRIVPVVYAADLNLVRTGFFRLWAKMIVDLATLLHFGAAADVMLHWKVIVAHGGATAVFVLGGNHIRAMQIKCLFAYLPQFLTDLKSIDRSLKVVDWLLLFENGTLT
jgi:hypothetical protein